MSVSAPQELGIATNLLPPVRYLLGRKCVDDMTSPLGAFGVKLDELHSSPVLTHDPEKEEFVGENAELANPFLRREYRKGYEVKPVA